MEGDQSARDGEIGQSIKYHKRDRLGRFKRSITRSDEIRLLRLYRDGHAYDSLTKMTGHSYSTISKIVHDNKVQLRRSPSGRLKHPDCIKCGVSLRGSNWFPAFAKTNNYACRPCALRKQHQRYFEKRQQILSKNRAATRALTERIRLSVLRRYSPQLKCRRCGLSGIRVLTIDHLHDDGAVHRKKGLLGSKFWRWLINSNFPEGYQVLCMNCNFAKGIRIIERRGSNSSQIRYQRRLRTRALKHYSPSLSCRICGCRDLKALTIDHMRGNGADQRRGGIKGYRFYLWLRRNGYPKGYQILCMNCQIMKRRERKEWKRPGSPL